MPEAGGLMLDSHVLHWWTNGEHHRLGTVVLDVLQHADVPIFVSAATPWELQIKLMKSRAALMSELRLLQIERAGFQLVDITAADGLAAGALPRHHDDPFDRMLIAQCMRRGLALVSADRMMRRYDIPVLPATA
jgi:PIN domain nuclease of toxin-antitoxin system